MTHSPVAPAKCRVVDDSKLPEGAGDARFVCSAIEAAAAKHAPGVDFTVEVKVKSPSALSAKARLANGKVVPEQNIAVSDGQLRKGSIERFAAAIGQAIAAAS